MNLWNTFDIACAGVIVYLLSQWGENLGNSPAYIHAVHICMTHNNIQIHNHDQFEIIKFTPIYYALKALHHVL